ncbi:SAV_2336 N-terminal domain-related protein [Nocardia sp. NPDC005366]|uniref:SAV_2336 N-terminal domain-related protein n=1 Tax=Nocardia sp. NPDC005366 TaxID=3156878 RepID=UPI0033A49E9F
MTGSHRAPVEELLASAYAQGTLTPQTLAEAIWLLDRLYPDLVTASETRQVDDPAQSSEPVAEPEPTAPEAPQTEHESNDSAAPTQQPGIQIVKAHDGPSRGTARPRPSASYALSESAELSRAMHPLHREIPAPGPGILDEAATVHAYGETRTLVPISTSVTEHWLDLAIVIDTSTSMALWRPTLKELTRMLRSHRAFRDVRIWSIDGDADRTRLQIGSAPGRAVGDRSSSELTDPTGRRLILIVTDGVGRLWQSTAMGNTMLGWANVSPLMVLNVLPERLWHRTGLLAVPVSMHASPQHSGLLHGRAKHPRLRANDNGQHLIPMVGLDPIRVNQWAAAVAGDRTAGQSMLAVPLPRPQALDTRHPAAGPKPTSAVELVKRFRLTASPTAYTLAAFLSAAPLTVPVMRLVQQELVPDSTPADLAEVFLSGLLITVPGMAHDEPDQIIYDFATGSPDEPTVREELLANLPRADAFRVLDLLAHHTTTEAEPFGGDLDFRTLVPETRQHAPSPDRHPFAQVVVAVLSGLGGPYQELAETIGRTVDRPEQRHTSVNPRPQLPLHSEASKAVSDIQEPDLAAQRANELKRPDARPPQPLESDTNDPRRFLIAVAVESHTEAPHWDRPGLERARAAMIELFTGRFGYTLVDTIGANPTSTQLLRELRKFCISPDRRPDDLITVYFTGHAERVGDRGDHMLIASDIDPTDIAAAVPTAELARQMLLGTKVRRLLLILDTCFSGQGAVDFAEEALRRYTRHWGADTGTGIIVISSAQPTQWAQAGEFPRQLVDAVDSLATAGYGPETLALDAVITAISENSDRIYGQDIEQTRVRVSGATPPFLPNPRWDPRLIEVDLAIQRADEWAVHSERRDTEFRKRLLVRAMGNQGDRGWWFCGRRTALSDITTWLTHPDTTRPLLAVTGDPGSGKTAVLGLIRTLTHPEYRRIVPLDALGLPSAAIPARGAVDVAIYAQNLTVDQVRGGIAAAAKLTATTTGGLAAALATRDRTLTVLIDGLDEADDPEQLCRKLLRPLLDHANRHLRLLIGTRPYLLPLLGTDRARSIDLDATRYADPAALAAYAARGLLEGDIYTKAPPDLIRDIAKAIAEKADPSFLVARIVAATVATETTIPDPNDPAWRARLPKIPGDAMHLDLRSRLGNDADRACDLLRPLAFAQGQGLPWEDLWAPLAARIAGEACSDDDIMWLRRTAGSYVVEATENGRSAYRLYHPALAAFLTRDLDDQDVHTTICRVLSERVPVKANGGRDWSRSHPYTLHHLAAHAIHAGLVDELVADMDYLVNAEPTSLLDTLNQARSDTARMTQAIYRHSARQHQALPPTQRRQILAIDAARFAATDQLRDLNHGLEWQVRWATGGQAHPAHRAALVGHSHRVSAVACTRGDARPVAVTAAYDETLRVWDLTTGTHRATLTNRANRVSAVACTSIDGSPVAVTGSWDGTARVWDLTTGTHRATLNGHANRVSAVACTSIDGSPVAVTGSRDGTARVWDLTSGAQLAVLTGHTDAVSGVACTSIDGRPVAATGSEDATVRVWDLTTGTQLTNFVGSTNRVFALACTNVDGRPVAVTGSEDATVRVWDLTTGTQFAVLPGRADPVSAVACTSIEGRAVAVVTGLETTVRIWDLATQSLMAMIECPVSPTPAIGVFQDKLVLGIGNDIVVLSRAVSQ